MNLSNRKQNFQYNVQEQLEMIRAEYQRSGKLPVGLQRLLELLQASGESTMLSLDRINKLAEAAYNGQDLLTAYPNDYAKLVSDEESQKKFIEALQRLESNRSDLSFLVKTPPKPTLFINEAHQWRCEWVVTSEQLAALLQQDSSEQAELFSSKFKVPEHEDGQIGVYIQQQGSEISLTIKSSLSQTCKANWGSFKGRTLSKDKTFAFSNIAKGMVLNSSDQPLALHIVLGELE